MNKALRSLMKILFTIIKFSGITILLLSVGCGRQEGRQAKKEDKLISQAEQWQAAISKGQVETALELANDICKNIPSPPIHTRISDLFQSESIRLEFINAKFNQWDFQYWKHATFFKKLARSITNNVENDDAVINKLFSAVQKQIESTEPPKGNILWPYTIWHLKKGICDRQAWVLCELAYQLGYETQIVYLRNPETLISPHTICELRKDAKVWLADPISNKLISNTSVADLAADPKLLTATWPNSKDYQEAIGKSVYWLPSYPQDYCPRNQVLRFKLEQVLGENCPRFGESPTRRLKKFLSLTSRKDRRFPYGFWFYPVRLLRAEAAKKRMRNHESDQADAPDKK